MLDVLSGETVRVLDGLTTRTRALAISPDGAIVAAPQPDGTIGLWSTASGALVGAAAGHHGAATALAFDAAGTRLYSASDDGTVRSWTVLVDA
jgi:WD40 repeat protein